MIIDQGWTQSFARTRVRPEREERISSVRLVRYLRSNRRLRTRPVERQKPSTRPAGSRVKTRIPAGISKPSRYSGLSFHGPPGVESRVATSAPLESSDAQ